MSKNINSIEVHVEYLFHYKCGACNQWWTIADKLIKLGVACPDCKTLQNVDKVIAHAEAPVVDEIEGVSNEIADRKQS
ncbi:MAG: hypothetical protein KME29_05005 [Calothrix sp. FI2-JRJ7]|jgi:phage FluMu protein Com|nr:hypothetical protein [Calothrix sp. FI2-JRJ7]